LNSGTVSGMVYGISTAGSIVGTLGTTFFLIPAIGSRAITYTLGAVGIFAAALLIGAGRFGRARLGGFALLLVSCILPLPAKAEEPFDPAIRAEILKRKSGLIAHVETVYNDIFVRKYENILRLSFHVKGWFSRESEANLADPEDLPMLYSRPMSIAAIYPPEVKRVLMLEIGRASCRERG